MSLRLIKSIPSVITNLQAAAKYTCYAKRPASHSYYIAFGDSVSLRLIKSIPSVTAYLHAASEYTAEAYTNPLCEASRFAFLLYRLWRFSFTTINKINSFCYRLSAHGFRIYRRSLYEFRTYSHQPVGSPPQNPHEVVSKYSLFQQMPPGNRCSC